MQTTKIISNTKRFVVFLIIIIIIHNIYKAHFPFTKSSKRSHAHTHTHTHTNIYLVKKKIIINKNAKKTNGSLVFSERLVERASL